MIDTIVAQSTAPGPGAVALVRVSGPEAVQVAARICPGVPAEPTPRTAFVTPVIDPSTEEVLDQGLATLFPGPASYTGEDVVEISCHGGWLSPVLVVDAAVAAGCRPAEPGEFTRRALLNGKLDLVQAEAVLDLIESRSRVLRRTALDQLDRGLSERVSSLRSALVRLEALLAHHVDFPEEDEAPVDVAEVAEQGERVVRALDELLRTAPEGELLREGAVTVLAGKPNAGKSSLFNALLGQDRAIVTPEPGTTRDAIEAVISLDGYPFRLVDTAGIRDEAGPVERLGVEVARRYVQQADLVLLCVDPWAEDLGVAERSFAESLHETPVVLIRTKTDLGIEPVGGNGSLLPGAPTVDVSARTGRGLDELAGLLPKMVYDGLVTAEPGAVVLTRRRHARALRTAREEVAQFCAALRDGVPAEVAGTHLRPAETALEELLGVISVDDVLDDVFQEFCIGK